MLRTIVTREGAWLVHNAEPLDMLGPDHYRYLTNEELYELHEFASQYDLRGLLKVIDEIVYQNFKHVEARERLRNHGRRRFWLGLTLGAVSSLLWIVLVEITQRF